MRTFGVLSFVALTPFGLYPLMIFDVSFVSALGGTVTVNNGEWHHVALTAEFETHGSNDTVRLYVDGSQDVVRSNWNVNKHTEAGMVFRMGFTNSNFPRPTSSLTGSLDDVRVYARALSAAEVASLAGR